MKILTIDPSGTGISGICLINDDKIQFLQYKSSNWKEHYNYLKEIINHYEIDLVIFEDTNYIHRRTKDGLSLFRFLGAIEVLENVRIDSINVLKVKKLTKQILKKEKSIKNLEYLLGRGKGWMFEKKRISLHCLEAYLIYYNWQEKIIK